MKLYLKLTLILLIAVVISDCSENEGSLSVSMVSLIASPNKYDGKRITVEGYLEGSIGFRLYLTKEHAMINDSSSSVSLVNLDFKDTAISEYCTGNYAVVKGRLKKLPNVPLFVKDVRFFIIDDLEKILMYDDELRISRCWEPNK